MKDTLKKLVKVLFLIISSFFIYKLTVNHSQFLGFQDENAHMTTGWLMNNGLQLYKDIFVNHQPFVYIVSNIIDTVFKPNSIFLLVKRHREIIFLYGLIWNMLYVVTAGWQFVFFYPIFETIKFLFLGNQFLGESLAVYPVIFITIITAKKILFNSKVKNHYVFLLSISLVLAFFSLAPLMPVVLLYIIVWTLILIKENKKQLFYFLLAILLLSASLFVFFHIPVSDYIRETVINNKKYQIPSYQLSVIKTIFKSFFLVFSTFSLSPNLIQILVLHAIILILIYALTIKNKHEMINFLGLILLVSLTNTREFSGLGNDYFGIFHALPWFGAFFSFSFCLFNNKSLPNKKYKFLSQIIFISMFLLIIFHPLSPIKNKRDMMNDHDINYSKFVTYGNVINVLKNDNDTLLAFPFETLILWQSKIKPATKLIEYYSWSYLTKEGRTNFINILEKKPPEFIYYEKDRGENPFDIHIQKTIEKKYKQLFHIRKPSYLYVKKTKAKTISQEQWNKAKYYLFELPNNNFK